MAKVRLTDELGYSLGEPDIPGPLPRVIVWGDEFFLANEADAIADVKSPRYRVTTGYVIIDTKETGSGAFKLP
jgi:hypothetical protein